jgi:methyltransferase family protein
MRYRDFLRGLHERLEPPAYLEVGVRGGGSLALARPPAVGIDPDYDLRFEIAEGVALFRETSDEYFARPDPLEPLGGRPVSLAFIDGMHLAEHALRDFINIERHADWTSVVVFDDILPRNEREALRQRETRSWTGDIFKIPALLERRRPDLICLRVGTEPTGLLLVLGLDPASTALAARYDGIAAKIASPDPQAIPREVRERRWVLDPERVLSSAVWQLLREARAGGAAREESLPDLRRAVRQAFGPVGPGRLRRMLRPPALSG